MIDTHAHLDALAEPPGEVLERARLAGVSRIVTIGSGLRSCRESLALAERERGVFAALGIHPHQAGTAGDGELGELALLLSHAKAVAVGETGLDHFRERAPRERQLELFRAQARLANEAGKPLVVHSRAADGETVAVLSEVEARTVVLHCFSSAGLLPAALERRWYVSFAGNVTYPKAEELRWAAAQVPADRLLAE
ncbi:MAG: TatD family hydrolase, partial [Actinomycetota bacterium]|nr:TatD family hydrolase [Actinomycetota bacterium]